MSHGSSDFSHKMVEPRVYWETDQPGDHGEATAT